MRFRRRRMGVSALFDAMLFFVILLAASGALFHWASALAASTTDDLATRGIGEYVSDIQCSALECTVGPVNYSSGGRSQAYTGSVHGCVLAILDLRRSDAGCEISGLVGAVREVYGLLVEKPFHFGLRASVGGFGPDLLVSERAGGPMDPGEVRWTCAVPLILDGKQGELVLYIWR